MTLQYIVNSIILALTLATVILTITTFVIHQFRRIPKYLHSENLQILESVYFKRYAPHLDIKFHNQENGLQLKKKLLSFRKVSIGYIFIVVSVILFSVFVSNYYATEKNISKINWNQRKDLLSHLQSNLSEFEKQYLFKFYNFKNMDFDFNSLQSKEQIESVMVKDSFVFTENKNIWPKQSDLGLFLAFSKDKNKIMSNEFKSMEWKINEFILSNDKIENVSNEETYLSEFFNKENIKNSAGMYFDRKTNLDVVIHNNENKSNFYEFQSRRIKAEKTILKPIRFFVNLNGDLTKELIQFTSISQMPVLISDFMYFNEMPNRNYLFLNEQNLLLLNSGTLTTDRILADPTVVDPDLVEQKITDDLSKNLTENNLQVILLDPEKIGTKILNQILTKVYSRFSDKKIYSFDADELFRWVQMVSSTSVEITSDGIMKIKNTSDIDYKNVPIAFYFIPMGENKITDLQFLKSAKDRTPASNSKKINNNLTEENILVQWIQKRTDIGSYLFSVSSLKSGQEIQLNLFEKLNEN